MTNDKQHLRAQARKHRANTDPLGEDPQDAAKLFFDIIKPTQSQIIAAYLPTGHEFDALIVLEQAIKQGITCALPVIEDGSRLLKFVEWTEKTKMTTGPHNIPQPADISKTIDPDIIITPLLAFDRQGTRLGQGGGYYDTTLAHYRAQKDIAAIGMCYSTQAVLLKLPSEPHDEKLDWVITPQQAHYFGEI